MLVNYSNILLLVVFWGVYFLIHSLLASQKVKSSLQFIGKFYRIFYVIIAIATLLPIIGWAAIQPVEYFWAVTNLTKGIGLFFATFGIFFMKKAFKKYSLKQFIGFQSEQQTLYKSGILAHVRHPIYTATILLVIGYFIFSPTHLNFVSTLCIFLYFGIGIRLEEKKLKNTFGEEYEAYQKKVPMLLPKDWRKALAS